MVYKNILHTNVTKYGDSIDLPAILAQNSDSLKQKINHLEAIETLAYRSIFGNNCNTYQDFRKAIRGVFELRPQDRKAILFFENSNIRRVLLKEFSSKTMTIGEQTTLEINFNKLPKINMNEILSSLNNSGSNYHFTGDNTIQVTVGLDTIEVKNLINQVFKRKFATNNEKGGQSTRRLKAFLKQFDKNSALYMVEGGAQFVTETVTNISDSPFNYNVQDIRDAIKNKEGTSLLNELIQATEEIHSWIKNHINYGALSPEMKRAFDEVWLQNISGPIQNEKIAFFMKGGALNSLVGAFGEFQTALIFQYVNLIIGNGNGHMLAVNATIADSLKKGEQAKADVTILGNIGIQVKNYNFYGDDELDTNLHPRKLFNYNDFAGQSDSIGTFLANYYFNQTYKDTHKSYFDELEKVLGTYMGEMYNLAIQKSVEDTVCFYYISGKYLIPGSAILKIVANDMDNTIKKAVQITSSYTAHTDEEFATPTERTVIRNHKKKTTYSPLFTTYWVHKSDGWHPTDRNKREFNRLLGHDISIRSGFHFRTLMNALDGGANAYSLF